MADSKYSQILLGSFQSWYGEGRDIWTTDETSRALLPFAIDSIRARRSLHILDVGTGRGSDVERSAALGHRATGIDLLRLPEWSRIEALYGNRVKFFEIALQALNARKRFDLIIDSGSFHHQHPNDFDEYLLSARKLLKPGGVFALSVFHISSEDGPFTIKTIDGRLFHFFDEDYLSEMLFRHGLQKFRTLRIDRAQYPLPYDALLIATRLNES